MRIRDFILGKPELESSARHRVAPPDQLYAWYASLSTYKQLLSINLRTNYITGSRTSGTHTLCAIASARRLCGN
jgi:hypothetical protein